MAQSTPLWTPQKQHIKSTRIQEFIEYVAQRTSIHHPDYHALYDWSVSDSSTFWDLLWDFCEVIGDKGERILVNGEDIEHAQWFPDARVNFAENLLRRRDDAPAIHFKSEDTIEYSLSFKDVYQQVSAVAAWLKTTGLQPGDRVAGYLPNMPETIIAMLATASVGGVWTSTSPDFGYESVIDRFGQTEPKVMFCADGYYYNGKTIDLTARVEQIQNELPTVHHTVTIPLIHSSKMTPQVGWQDIVDEYTGNELEFTPMSFNDPLYILYSSGTTGKPKCITHKIGGVLLQHLKEHQLHCDIRPNDKVFYFTTCGWMMWNWLVTALASNATVVLYDGSPFYPANDVLWQYAEDIGMTLFGTSAKYIDTMKKQGMAPIKTFPLPKLRTICSTGSVLSPEGFDYVYEMIKRDVCLSSISGGTDIISCFIQGCPILPVYRGECQCRGLAMATRVFNADGQAVTEEKGELVCTQTFPAQPVYFWNDPDGKKYHSAYFTTYPNVWHHGDYVKLTENGGMVIYGRSDATLNPGGVRIGTAEIYRHVEQLDEVVEAIVIGQEWERDTRIVLFVVLKEEAELTPELITTIRDTIRKKCSPRHVPAKVIQVAEIPRTKSGKIVELAVSQVVHNREVKNSNSLANPDALELFRNIKELTE